MWLRFEKSAPRAFRPSDNSPSLGQFVQVNVREINLVTAAVAVALQGETLPFTCEFQKIHREGEKNDQTTWTEEPQDQVGRLGIQYYEA